MIETFRWLAAVIAAHQEGKVVGRTRLQKTIKLLQRLGLPTRYLYKIFFYGPYSEGVQSDIGLLERLKLITEEKYELSDEEKTYYIIKASPEAELPEIQEYLPYIQKMEMIDTDVLELAATYDAFRHSGANHQDALERLHWKKGKKCINRNVENALALLEELGLPSGEARAAM